MNNQRNISRRNFFKQANCAAVGTASICSTLFTLRMTAGAASGGIPSGYKAIVCLFLNGGNDSFNMLVPRETNSYNTYSSVRGGVGGGGLALDSASLLPITTVGQPDTEYGIHPHLPFLQKMYDGAYISTDPLRTPKQDLAFIANVGTLVEPTTIAQYNSKSVLTPVGLFSHSDEQIHWQTLVPQIRGAGPKGWAGRMADCMSQANLNASVGMNISLSGNNVLQVGPASIPYITDPAGAVGLKGYDDATVTNAVNSILGEGYQNIYQKTLAARNRSAIDTAEAFNAATGGLATTEAFANDQDYDAAGKVWVPNGRQTQLDRRLQMVSKVIAARSTLGMNRQVFFVERGGWDHHNEVLFAQEDLFNEVNGAIESFWNELGYLGLQDDVVLFTASDFGRTLTSNGAGSDHAWGGNAFMLGGNVAGGKIYGTYPDDLTDVNLDLGRGRILPTTAVDEYCAELASWFGVPESELSTVFPNFLNFPSSANPYPLEILGTNS